MVVPCGIHIFSLYGHGKQSKDEEDEELHGGECWLLEWNWRCSDVDVFMGGVIAGVDNEDSWKRIHLGNPARLKSIWNSFKPI